MAKMQAQTKHTVMHLRLPDDLWATVREIAAHEERPLNTQVIRFIRAGIAQYEAEQKHPRVRRVS